MANVYMKSVMTIEWAQGIVDGMIELDADMYLFTIMDDLCSYNYALHMTDEKFYVERTWVKLIKTKKATDTRREVVFCTHGATVQRTSVDRKVSETFGIACLAK